MTMRINWAELAVTEDGGDRLTWDVPHNIYKGTSSLSRSNPGEPIAVLPPNQTVYIDTEVTLGTTYYYRIGEVRPGGTYVSEMQFSCRVVRHVLKLEALFLAQELYGTGETDNDGNLKPLEEFSGPIPNEWLWNGVGNKGEWLEYIVNGNSMLVKYRGDTIVHLGNIVFERDDRNYPAATINYGNPFTGTFYYVDDELIQAPHWWPQYWNNVNVNDYPDSWNSFWENRRNDPNVDNWYSNLWRI